MERKVYLVGDIGDRFGRTHSVHADTYSDVMKCIEANNPTLKKYLLEAHEAGVGFTLEIEGKSEEHEEDLLLPIKPGDITISAIPAGSKSGGAKIFAALVLAFFVLPMIGAGSFVGPGMTTMEGIGAAMATTAGKVTSCFFCSSYDWGRKFCRSGNDNYGRDRSCDGNYSRKSHSNARP